MLDANHVGLTEVTEAEQGVFSEVSRVCRIMRTATELRNRSGPRLSPDAVNSALA